MNVAGGDDRLIQLLAQPDDRAVIFPQRFFVRHLTVSHHEQVVVNRLDFQIIVEPGDLFQRRPRLAAGHRTVQLARFTGAAEQQALAIFDENAFRNARLLVEIIQMRIGNQLIQILKARLILHQNDLMHRADFFRVPPGQAGVDVFDACRAGILF